MEAEHQLPPYGFLPVCRAHMLSQYSNHAYYIQYRLKILDQRMFSRDFAYPVSSPLHFGHRTKAIRASIPPLENYEARVVYPYDAAIDGELSVDANEVLLVLKNLGNGWVCARRRSQTGLVPENYIQRIFQR